MRKERGLTNKERRIREDDKVYIKVKRRMKEGKRKQSENRR